MWITQGIAFMARRSKEEPKGDFAGLKEKLLELVRAERNQQVRWEMRRELGEVTDELASKPKD